MQKNLRLLVAITLTLGVSACATAPNPEKVCTTDWIETRLVPRKNPGPVSNVGS